MELAETASEDAVPHIIGALSDPVTMFACKLRASYKSLMARQSPRVWRMHCRMRQIQLRPRLRIVWLN